MASDPLSRRQRELIDSTRRARPVLIVCVVVGAGLALASAVYSIRGLQQVTADPQAASPPVPAMLTPLVGSLGPRLPWVVAPDACEEREERLMTAQEENARLRVYLVLVMWYGLAGAVGASLGLLLGGLSLNSLQWMDIVQRLESANKP